MVSVYINFFAISLISLFVGSVSITKNLIYSFLISFFIIIETISFLYFGRSVNEEFLFFASNLDIYNFAVNIKLLFAYYSLLLFILLWVFFYFILLKVHIKKFKKCTLATIFVFLMSPWGFLYIIFYTISKDYIADYYAFKDYSYQDIYKNVKGKEYVEDSKLEIFKSNKKYKNLVLIYMESYEQELLTNNEINIYTKNINKLTKEGEFYENIEQIPWTNGTLAGMFSSQCGSQYSAYFLMLNPYDEVRNNLQFVCLSNVLNKAGYNQVFIGGANKKLFNKGNFMLSHKYDTVMDNKSLLEEHPEFKNNLVTWGVADRDVFNVGKSEYKKLSKSKKPFNLTILTTATHNPNGEYDKRCLNPTKNKLLNAVECTDFLVSDFVKFLKKQKNYKDTLIVILPDHKQYKSNNLRKILSDYDKRKLFVIMLNSGIIKIHNGDIYYTDLAEILLKKLNVNSNATFLNKQDDTRITKNFIHKIHKD